VLVSPLDYETAWKSSDLVIWHGFTPFKFEVNLPENTFVTKELEDSGIRICSGEGIVNCALNPTHTPA